MTNRHDCGPAQSEAEHSLHTGQFAATLRAAIKRRGLSLQRISVKLGAEGFPVSPAALSYWQRGTNRPERAASLRAVEMLEEILEMPPGALLTLLGPPRPRGRWNAPSPADRRTLWTEAAALDDALRLLGEETAQRLADVSHLSLHVRSVLGADLSCAGSNFRRVLRAERDRVDRVLVVVHTSGARLLIEGLNGCRIGRIRSSGNAEYTVAELVLDRLLARGETAAIDYTLRSSDHRPRAYTRHVLYRPADVLVLEADFHPDSLPALCTAFYSPRRTTPELALGPLSLGSTHRAHVTVAGAGPGMYGVRWE
ncbi:helix-turn-helix domain-containing protein [Streptomyces rubiginosohelvolus]|uniref:helix-turn-helix domain-containing protein n=1 Tax=Streptomyces rubiginosohelvolus TaxID=67362 RepID=UPI0034479EA2